MTENCANLLHEFRSITEQQWKSGLSRFKCALCSQDYGDPIHCVATTPSLESNWPLVIAIEDCFVPESAQLVVEVAGELQDQTCTVLWALAGMRASGEICRN